MFSFLFFFNDTATTEIYTLSLHDALPIFCESRRGKPDRNIRSCCQLSDFLRRLVVSLGHGANRDRKSTRLNSSHRCISYAVFCLKKKKKKCRQKWFTRETQDNRL